MKKYFILTLCLIISLISFAQNSSSEEIQQIFYKAYYSNNIQLWEMGIQKLQSTYNASKDRAVLEEIALAKFGLINACMGNKEKEKAEKVTDDLQSTLEKLLKENGESPSINALYGGVLGLQIGFSPMKGMWLGSKSSKHIEKALKLKNNHPDALYHKGSSYYHTPSMFGGDLEKAVESYSKAISNYEQGEESLVHNWQYLNTLAWLGNAYMKTNQKEKAISTYKKCIEQAPEFGWVKYQLVLAQK